MNKHLNEKDESLISLLREYRDCIKKDQTELREIGGILHYKIALFNRIYKFMQKTLALKTHYTW